MARHNAGNIAKIKKRDDFRGKYPDYLNEDVAYHLAWALMETVFKQPGTGGSGKADVAVGWDARLSSPALAEALLHGLDEHGATVYSLGQCSSEMVYFAVGDRADMVGGVMITASHNPKDENGFKIVKRGAESISSDDLNDIAAHTARLLDLSHGQPISIAEQYAEKVKDVSGIPGEWEGGKLRVVVEAGNGTGGLAFQAVARKLPYLDVVYSNAQPDGNFPVCLPNPVKPDYMELVRDRVLKEGADLGLAFDGDGDRVGVVDAQGEIITPSEVMALIVDRLLAGKPSGVEIMYNLTCSRLVHDCIRSGNATPLMTPVGHGQIKPVLRQHPRCVFAGEHSGHYFFPHFFYADSGMVAALMILKQLMSLRQNQADLHEKIVRWRKTYFACPETNFDMRLADPRAAEAKQQQLKQECVENARQYGLEQGGTVVERYDAPPSLVDPPRARTYTLKMEFSTKLYDWWFCVRPSGNEPLLRLNVEVVLKEEAIQAGADGSARLRDKFDALVQVLGPQYREK